MKLSRHPRLAMALCAVAVLACAAMPAAFLAVTDAAYFGKVEQVENPYTAPTPTAEDYYILRQLAARSQTNETQNAAPAETPQAPKMYVGAEVSLSTMNYADSTTADAAEAALQQMADCGAVPEAWVQQALDAPTDYDLYTDYSGQTYDLGAAYCSTDSLGFVTVRRFARSNNVVFTRYSVTIDSRTGAVVEAWLSMPAVDAENTALPDEAALRAFAAQAGLESLGDWATPTGSEYGCALYSANGNALITASTHPYTYTNYTTSGYELTDRWYYSLTLQQVRG